MHSSPSWNIRCLAALLGAVVVVACDPGAAGPGGPTGGSSVSDTLLMDTGISGVVQSNGTVLAGTTIFAGDRDAALPGITARGFLTFDLTSIPVGKTIRTARLKVIQSSVTGSPYGDLGNLVVDHVIYGPTLDSADYNLAVLSSAFSTLSDSAPVGTRFANVFQRVNADLQAGRTVSQFRVRFSLKDGNNNGFEDKASLNHILNDPPLIVILTYN